MELSFTASVLFNENLKEPFCSFDIQCEAANRQTDASSNHLRRFFLTVSAEDSPDGWVKQTIWRVGLRYFHIAFN